MKITEEANTLNFVIYNITSTHTTDPGDGHFDIPVSYVSGTFTAPANNANIVASFLVSGDRGSQGAQGAQGATGAQGAQGSVATPTDDTATDATYYPIFAIATANNTLKTSSTKLYYNPSTGTLNATNFNSLSDETVKENIQKIQDATNLLDMINPVSFTWKDTGSLSYGVIAQEIEKVLPNIVATNQDNGLKSVSYDQLIPILVQAIKELKIEIEHLKSTSKNLI